MAEYVVERPAYGYAPSALIYQVINTVIGLIETLLVLRLVLELLGASAYAPFVAWIYQLTDSLVAPFSGAFPSWYIGGFPLDLSTLFAMVGYAIIGWLLVRMISFVFASL